ncbi:WD repeat-containing protein 44 [Perkinsus chesapeaki]|uniref:Mitochondrial fission process protein 1 n=1 Tax=Perkinsus chesapeaki TaxID=330153 RepID=A0A7J6L691_PERCH|nr:WD repeat-containing protein 44 [Perkinsus chesapeaki]
MLSPQPNKQWYDEVERRITRALRASREVTPKRLNSSSRSKRRPGKKAQGEKGCLVTPANLGELAALRARLRNAVKILDTKFTVPWEEPHQGGHHVQAAASIEMLKAALAEDDSQAASLPTPNESPSVTPVEPASASPDSAVSESTDSERIIPTLGRHGGSAGAPLVNTVIFDDSDDTTPDESFVSAPVSPRGSAVDDVSSTLEGDPLVTSFSARGKSITGLHVRERLKTLFSKDRRGSSSSGPDHTAAVIPVAPLLTSIPFSRTTCVLLLSEMTLPLDCVVSQLAVCGKTGDIAAGCINGEIYLWTRVYGSVYTKNAEVVLKGHVDSISHLHWTCRGELITCSLDASTRIWLPRESKLPVSTLHHYAFKSAGSDSQIIPTFASTAPVPKGSSKLLLMIACSDGTIEIYSVPEELRKSPYLRHRVKIEQMATCVALSPDGMQIAVGSAVGTVSLFIMKSLRGEGVIDCRNKAGKLRSGRKVTSIQWEPSGQRIVHLRDLSKRSKFKSSLYYTNQSMMLMAVWPSGTRKRVLSVGESGWFCGWQVDYSAKDTNTVPLVSYLLDGIGQQQQRRRQTEKNGTLTPPEIRPTTGSTTSQPLSSPRHVTGSQSGPSSCTASYICPIGESLSGHPLVDTVFGRVGQTAQNFSLITVATSNGYIRLCLDLTSSEWQHHRALPTLPMGQSIDTYDYHKKTGDFLRDTELRYLAFAQRVLRVVAPSAKHVRYLAFTSDVGEAFRPVVPKWLVNFSYATTVGYIFGDIGYSTWLEYKRTKDLADQKIRVWTAAAKATTFQMVASLALPFAIIHSTVHYSGVVLRRLAPKNARLLQLGPTMIGLAIVPFLPVVCDKPIEHGVDLIFEKWGPKIASEEAATNATTTSTAAAAASDEKAKQE